MIKSKIGKEITSIYTRDGKEIIEVRDNQNNIVYSTIDEISGVPPLSFMSHGGYLQDCRIYGNTVQNSIPSPEAPVDVVGSGVRTGNLFSSTWEQGSIDRTTGQNIDARVAVRTKDYIPIKPNIAYSFSRNLSNGYMYLRLYRADKSYIGPGSDSTIRLISGTSAGNPMGGTDVHFCCFEVIDSEAAYIRFNDTSNSTATKWHMVEGEYTRQTMPEYEPYGFKLPLTVNGTEYPIYLGQVETTRRIKKLVLTGEEIITIKQGNAKWFIPIADLRVPTTSSITWYCSHYQAVANNAPWASYDYMISWSTADIGSSRGLRIRDINFLTGATVADFKAYLAQQYANGTPVTIWHVLAEPETAIVNEPIQKIGDYSDELSIADIPTINGINTISADTTVQPSEMYIKGKIKSIT